MTNKEKNAYIYLNYGKILDKNIDDFHWKSEGSYNEYIDISIDDPYFISRKIKNIDGEYYLDPKFERNIEGFKNVGIPVGLYFYSYANSIEGAKKDALWVIVKMFHN